MKDETFFSVDPAKCIGCGNCVNVCAGMVLQLGDDNRPYMKDFEEYGWGGCWRCQHCLAVCPTAAISIFEKDPKDSLPPPDKSISEQMDALVANRRSCRRYIQQNVDHSVIEGLVHSLQNAPTGGNAQMVEFTIVDDIRMTRAIWDVVHTKMEEQARQGIYGYNIGAEYYSIMEQSEEYLRPGDQLFCTAPHLFIAHQEISNDCWAKDCCIDCDIITAYFELLCASRGLGVNMMTYTVGVFDNIPEARKMLHIPESHYLGVVVGFGYPEIVYKRGVQRENINPVHYLS
ncbi:MAG: nitroreductase family protein [Lachnospiraceae bacterium]|nr:nitroreductase family protein [Lachnospiraceae bacterium]